MNDSNLTVHSGIHLVDAFGALSLQFDVGQAMLYLIRERTAYDVGLTRAGALLQDSVVTAGNGPNGYIQVKVVPSASTKATPLFLDNLDLKVDTVGLPIRLCVVETKYDCTCVCFATTRDALVFVRLENLAKYSVYPLPFSQPWDGQSEFVASESASGITELRSSVGRVFVTTNDGQYFQITDIPLFS